MYKITQIESWLLDLIWLSDMCESDFDDSRAMRAVEGR